MDPVGANKASYRIQILRDTEKPDVQGVCWRACSLALVAMSPTFSMSLERRKSVVLLRCTAVTHTGLLLARRDEPWGLAACCWRLSEPVTEQTRWGGAVNDILLPKGPTLFLQGSSPPPTGFPLPTTRGKASLNARGGWKEKELFI